MRYILLLILLASVTPAFAQKSPQVIPGIIRPKTVYMINKAKADTGVLTFPVVSDQYPALKKALNKNLFLGNNLASVIKGFETNQSGITGLEYGITYHRKNILSIIINYSTIGAYPDESETWLTLDMATGKSYNLNNEITAAGKDLILKRYKAFLYKQLQQQKADIKSDKELTADDRDGIIRDLQESIDQLKADELFNNFVINSIGLVVKTENALPHSIRCFELVHEWPIPYKDLQPYKKATARLLK